MEADKSKLWIVLIGVMVFGWFVWPTQYRYDHMQFGYGPARHEGIIRINRFSGVAEVLSTQGWRRLEPTPPRKMFLLGTDLRTSHLVCVNASDEMVDATTDQTMGKWLHTDPEDTPDWLDMNSPKDGGRCSDGTQSGLFLKVLQP